jgi:hypothetical protein
MSDTNDIAQRLRDLWRTDYSRSLLDSAANEISRLRADLAKRTAERDEARREVCVSEGIDRLQEANPNALISYSESRRVSREIATERGWNCYDLIDEKEAKP